MSNGGRWTPREDDWGPTATPPSVPTSWAAPDRSGPAGSGGPAAGPSTGRILAVTAVIAAIAAAVAIALASTGDDSSATAPTTTHTVAAIVPTTTSTTEAAPVISDIPIPTTTLALDSIDGAEAHLVQAIGLRWLMPSEPSRTQLEVPITPTRSVAADMWTSDLGDWAAFVGYFDTEGLPYDLDGGITGAADNMGCTIDGSIEAGEIHGRRLRRAEVDGCGEDGAGYGGSIAIVSNGSMPLMVMVFTTGPTDGVWELDRLLRGVAFPT